MAEAVLEIVLEKLSSLAAAGLGLFLGFHGHKGKLDSMFTAIKATLQDAEEKQFSSLPVKDWLRKLKDAAYELEDIMDDCAYQELWLENQGVSHKVLCSCLSSFHPKHAVFRYKIAKRMKSISERLDDIAKEKEQLHLVETVLERRCEVSEWRQTTSLITEPQVYGREKDQDKIVDFLVGDASRSEDLSVYPIVGLGGLGKTTLAQLIFNHERVVSQFELRIWVCVSEDFSLKGMTKAIIEAASGHASEDLDQEPLQRKLQDLLQHKRYLLVLDDVWDDEQENWKRLRSVLACGAMGSSILVTTRLSTVAAIMGTMPSHDLSILSHDDCWELFKHRAFKPNEVEHVRLEEIGKEIVRKCGGVPLAAKALGGLLCSERREEEWLNVKESNLWSLPHNIMPALRLSYSNLPIKLRQCFAYCAIFPKDKRIEKQYLIELWVANGFISSSGLSDAESVGDRVWYELYWRSFFQDLETDKFGKVTHFKMHDLVHDLAQSIAEEACFITQDNDLTTLSERIQHLSQDRFCRTAIQLHKFKSLRSYVLQDRGDWWSAVGVKISSSDVLKCYSLRVLDFVNIHELPSSIADLKHLRYLNLSGGDFKTLPESLCKLFNLQTLILDGCSELEKLPNGLSSCLKGLQQLSLDCCWSLSSLAPEIGKLTSLSSLTTYFVGKEKGFLLAELGPLKLKGDLEIVHLERVKSVMDAKDANMSIKKLNKLRLGWDRNEEWESQEKVEEEILEVLQPDTEQLRSLELKGYKGVHFPQWMSSSSLQSLYLEKCKEDLLSSIHKLSSLQTLCVGENEELTRFPDGMLQNMTALKRLSFWNLSNIESLPDCFGDLPSLRQLSIEGCWKLWCLPTSLSLSSLEWLNIHRCPELKKRCEKERGEDWPKIAHIPDVSVDYCSLQKESEGTSSGKNEVSNIVTIPGETIITDIQNMDSLLSKARGSLKNETEGTSSQTDEVSSKLSSFNLRHRALGLTEPPDIERWHSLIQIELMDNQICELPQSPNCPKLKVLLLQGNVDLMDISDSFFNHMPLLQHLDLSYTSIRDLPPSVSKLIQLKKFYLRGCDLFMELPPQIGQLKNLKELDLDGTLITHLSKEIGELINLQSLTLCFDAYHHGKKGKQISKSTIIPPGLISNLTQLKYLSINVDPEDEQWNEDVNRVLVEIFGLERLETVSIYVPEAELLELIPAQISLSFRLVVGHHLQRFISRVTPMVEQEFKRCGYSLKFVNGVGVPIGVKMNLEHFKALYLDRHMTIKSLSDFELRNLCGLEVCILAECNKMETIVDGGNLHDGPVLSNLEFLSAFYMKNLRSICEGPNPSFLHLKSIALHTCPMLTTVFTIDSLQNLSSLEVIIIEDCPKLTTLISHDNSPKQKTYFVLPSLSRISLLYLPKLVNIFNGLHVEHVLEEMVFYYCPKLQSLSKSELSSKYLNVIQGESMWWEALKWNAAEWGDAGVPKFFEHIFSPINEEAL